MCKKSILSFHEPLYNDCSMLFFSFSFTKISCFIVCVLFVVRSYPIINIVDLAPNLAIHSELFGLFSFGNWKFENLPISILLSIILLFIPYIFIIQSKKNYRLCKTLKKIVLKSGENCFFATFSIFSLVSQGTNLVKTHIVATFCRKY